MVALTQKKEKRQISYFYAPLRSFSVTRTQDNEVRTINTPEGDYKPTERFWRSFFSRFGISGNIFKYYNHQEVFERISRVESDPVLRVSHDDDGNLYAVSSPDKPVLDSNRVYDIIEECEASSYQFDNGVVTAWFSPNNSDGGTTVMGDAFKYRYVTKIPVDGYGNTLTYLAMLRMVCTNGMIAEAPAFKSIINTGKNNQWTTLRGVFRNFDNSEGYEALSARLESAAESWASVAEYKMIIDRLSTLIIQDKKETQEYLRAVDLLRKVLGVGEGVIKRYGVSHLDAISPKKQRLLPTDLRVYDLINLVTEVQTHYRSDIQMSGTIGTMLSREYDLEGSAKGKKYDPAPFLIAS